MPEMPITTLVVCSLPCDVSPSSYFLPLSMRSCAEVSFAAGASLSVTYPQNHCPGATKHVTRMPNSSSLLLHTMQGTDVPREPSASCLHTVSCAPAFLRTQQTTWCLGTFCLCALTTQLLRRLRSAQHLSAIARDACGWEGESTSHTAGM